MTRNDYPFIEDMLKLAGNLARGLMEKAKDARPNSAAAPTALKSLLQSLTASMDVATRDEMDAALAMMAKIRARQDALEARLDTIKGQSKPKKRPASQASKKRPALRPASTRKAPVKSSKKKR